MSTRSTIGIIDSKGKEKKIYCRYDGYLDGVGKTLLKSWNSPDKINELMEFGSISELLEYPFVTVLGKNNQEYRMMVGLMTPKNDIKRENVGGTYDKTESYNYIWKNGEWWVKFFDDDYEEHTLPLRIAKLGFEGHKTSVPQRKRATPKKHNPLPSKKDCPVKVNIRGMI